MLTIRFALFVSFIFVMPLSTFCQPSGGKKTNPPRDVVKKALQELQGKWQLVEMEFHGKKAIAGVDHFVTIMGDEMTLTFPCADSMVKNSKFKIDPTKSPKELDIEIVERLGTQSILAIYSIETGPKLGMALMHHPSTLRPKEFRTKGEDALVVFTREHRQAK